MKRCLFLAVLGLLIVRNCYASPEVYGASKDQLPARAKVLNVIGRLSTRGEWMIFIIPEKEWKAGCGKVPFTAATGCTFVDKRTTYLNAAYVDRANDGELIRTLSHEYGHILCNCRDENAADVAGSLVAPY